jgi:glyoxylase I family protein
MMTSIRRLGHLALRVRNLARARAFYVDILKLPVQFELPDRLLLNVHGLIVALVGDDPHTAANDHFDPYRVGLDHLALTVPDVEALDELLAELNQAGVSNHGIEIDEMTGASYISFYDPDGIAWEFYVTPTRRSVQ